MVDPPTMELDERIVRLHRLVESVSHKIDALTDCVVSVARRLDVLEERFGTQILTESEIAKQVEHLSDEIEEFEEEQASYRWSSNAVTPAELDTLLKGVGR